MLTENLTLEVQADCQYSGIFVNFEHYYLPSVKERKKMIPLSLLNLLGANFTERVIFKQAPSVSFESFMHFLNAHLIRLLISLNVLLIILFSICIYHILKKPFPKLENTEWQGVWRGLGETLERWTSSVSVNGLRAGSVRFRD